jgi:hypothetical protein
VAVAAMFFGFAAAIVRTGLVAAPVLPRTTIGPIGGFVESIEERRDGGRLVIRFPRSTAWRWPSGHSECASRSARSRASSRAIT